MSQNSHNYPGFFVSLEGTDGAGKTTQVQRLKTRLEVSGLEVVTVREPGGTAIGEQVRDILKNPASKIGNKAELLLFAACRAQLIEEIITPALAAGKIVIADRFVDSTVVYQGIGRGLIEEVDAVNAVAVDYVPDQTYVLSVSPEVAAQRLSERTTCRIEQSGEDFFKLVHAGFKGFKAARFTHLNADTTPDALEHLIWSSLRLSANLWAQCKGDLATNLAFQKWHDQYTRNQENPDRRGMAYPVVRHAFEAGRLSALQSNGL